MSYDNLFCINIESEENQGNEEKFLVVRTDICIHLIPDESHHMALPVHRKPQPRPMHWQKVLFMGNFM